MSNQYPQQSSNPQTGSFNNFQQFNNQNVIDPMEAIYAAIRARTPDKETNEGMISSFKELVIVHACWNISGYSLADLASIKSKYEKDLILEEMRAVAYPEWVKETTRLYQESVDAANFHQEQCRKMQADVSEAAREIAGMLGKSNRSQVITRSNYDTSAIGDVVMRAEHRALFMKTPAQQRNPGTSENAYARYLSDLNHENACIKKRFELAQQVKDLVEHYESLLYPATEESVGKSIWSVNKFTN